MADQFIIEVTDPTQVKFVEELLAHFDFVKFKRTTSAKPLKKTKKEKEFQDGLREALSEVNDDLKGKRKMQSARSFLDELRSWSIAYVQARSQALS